MTILIIGIAVVGIVLGAAGAVWEQDYWRQRKAKRELKPILDLEAGRAHGCKWPQPRPSCPRTITFRPTTDCRPRRSGWSRTDVETPLKRGVRCVTMSPRTSGPQGRGDQEADEQALHVSRTSMSSATLMFSRSMAVDMDYHRPTRERH